MPEAPATLAIDGGTPLRAGAWPAPPEASPAADADPVAALEREIAAYLDLPPGAVIASATADEAYRAALGIIARTDERDEIVVPALLGDRAIEAARALGWRVVPGELEADTGALSARGLSRALGERTAGVVVGHAFGHPATMTDLLRVAQDRALTVIEDLSGALGASFRGAAAGRMGQVGVLSCAAGDPVSRGAYAIVPTPDAAARVRSARTDALDEADARIALAEVRGIEDELLERRRLAWELTFNLRGMKGVTAMAHGRWVHHAYARYVVRIRSILWKRTLEETLAAIRAEGVPCDAATGPSLHLDASVRAALPDDARLDDDGFPVASRLPRELIAIPLHSGLTSKDMDQVAAVLRKVEARSI